MLDSEAVMVTLSAVQLTQKQVKVPCSAPSDWLGLSAQLQTADVTDVVAVCVGAVGSQRLLLIEFCLVGTGGWTQWLLTAPYPQRLGAVS